MLAAVTEHGPCPLPCAHWAHGAPLTLHLIDADDVLLPVSACGVQQGNP
jgi:hypothetical protein